MAEALLNIRAFSGFDILGRHVVGTATSERIVLTRTDEEPVSINLNKAGVRPLILWLKRVRTAQSATSMESDT